MQFYWSHDVGFIAKFKVIHVVLRACFFYGGRSNFFAMSSDTGL